MLRPHAPILCGLLQSLDDTPTVAGLDDWIYNGSDGYASLGALLGEMHPSYESLAICHTGDMSSGHNSFEEFVIDVINSVAEYHFARPNFLFYEVDKLLFVFFRDIVGFKTQEDADYFKA